MQSWTLGYFIEECRRWTLEGLLASLPPLPPGHSEEVQMSKIRKPSLGVLQLDLSFETGGTEKHGGKELFYAAFSKFHRLQEDDSP